MNMEERTILQDLLISMRMTSQEMSELKATVGILASELKNHTCRFLEDHKELKERMKMVEMKQEDLSLCFVRVNNKVDSLKVVDGSERNLMKNVLAWVQWLILLAVAVIQVYKG